MTGSDIIKDGVDRIMLGFREARFTRREMELCLRWFEEAANIVRKKLYESQDKGEADAKAQ